MVETEDEMRQRIRNEVMEELNEERTTILEDANVQKEAIIAEVNRAVEASGTNEEVLITNRFLGGESPLNVGRTDEKMAKESAGVSKKDREDLKEEDFKGYQKLKENAQKDVPKRFMLMDKIDLNDKNLSQLKGVTSVITALEELRTKLEEFDMTDVFTIPDDFDLTDDGNPVHCTIEQSKSFRSFQRL